MPEIISFGEALIDLIGEKKKGIKNSSSFQKCFGGAPANYAVACARLGAKTALMTRISKDAFGDFLVETLKREKIDISLIKRTPQKTTLAIVALNKEGKPDFGFYRENTADINVIKEDIRDSMFKDAKIFHFCSLSLTMEPVRSALFRALELAKKNKLIISFDPNLRTNLLKEDTLLWVKKALKYADVFLPSEEEAIFLTGEKNLDKAAKLLGNTYEINKVIITRGKNGSTLHEKNKKTSFEGFKIKVSDTTGAGDAFSAGVSVGLLKKYEGMELLHFANAVAAISVQKIGAISSLPKLKEVKKFLKAKA